LQCSSTSGKYTTEAIKQRSSTGGEFTAEQHISATALLESTLQEP
jgi:hypothetical protein